MSKQLWTREGVLDCIRELHRAGHDLSRGNAFKIARKLVSAAERHLGGWGRAVQAAGIDYTAIAEAARQRTLARRAKWSKERIVECIRKAAEGNEPLQASVISRTRLDLYAAARSPRYFGGWTNALNAAGIQVERDRPGTHKASLAKWRADLLLERIGQLAEQDRAVDEYDVRALAPALHEALIQRFGSWAGVMRVARSTTGPKPKPYRRVGDR